MNRAVLTALGIAALIVVVAVILATGGGGVSPTDPEGDPVVEGEGAPRDPSAVDIAASSVTVEGDEVVFVAEMFKPLENGPRDRLDFRWDVSEAGTNTWMVSAEVNGRAVASLTSLQGTYGSSTIDGTMPGSVSVEGDVLTIRVRASEVPEFPRTFDWILTTTLDADPRDPASGVARDTAPDGGVGKVEG